MIALSCIVVVCTVYALSLPAQTLACDKEEHTHTAECYDENNQLICEKEEHTHTDDCYKQEEVNEQEEDVKDEPETQNNDEQVSQESEEETTTTTTTETTTEPFDLNNSVGKIESIVITDDKNNSSIPGGTLSPNSKFLKITVNFKDINASELNSKYGRSFSYTLPKFFRMTGNTNTTIKDKSNIVIATIRVEDRKVVITYTEKYINSGTNTSLNGDFFVEGEVDLSQLNKNDGKTILTTPKGDITLDYGQDYLEKFGDVEVKKAYSKPDPKSDYIQYTITVSSQNGSKNVYVVDKFTNNSQLVSYMGDISNTPQDLTTSSDGQKPYETRTTDVAGKIYLTDMQTSDDEIPKQVTDSSSINQPGSLVWSISELKPNESRTLTYFVKLSDDKNLNNQSITNIASAYTKKEGGKTYVKGKDGKTFTPNISYNMPKTMVEKIKDDDGNYIVKYKLEFTLNSSSNYPLKNFMFYDYLNYYDMRTDETMLPYISYERSTVELYQTKDGKDTLVDPSNYKVEWEMDGTNYKADWSDSDGNPKRFRIRGTDSNPFTVYPGDSYYVTYKLKIKPEVYAAMQSNIVDVLNRYVTNADNAKKNGDVIDKWHRKLQLNDYNWVEKKKEATVTNQVQTISMSGSDVYVKKKDGYEKDSSVNSFNVPAGSYQYTVNVNKTMNQFDVTEATLKDVLSSDVMHYVGYVKITPYKYDATLNKYVDQKPKWVKIDNETSFELKLSQIGWTNNNNSYRFDYYAQTNDLSEVGKVEVKNTFSLSGDVVKGNQTFKFNNVGSSQTIQVNGHYSLSVNKSAWYYEKPQENATSYMNGKLYWVIEVSGTAIRKDTQIQDAISKDDKLTDSFLHSDSIAGIYQGKPAKNINLYGSFEEFKNSNTGLVDKSKSFDQKFENSKNFTGTDVHSELTLTAKETISLNNDENLYIVIMTEPQSLPSAYRAEFTYRNVALMKDISDQSFIERDSASQILYGGPNILKELGQTFTYDGKTVTTIQADHDKDNPGSKICTDILNKANSKGAFISWAFKVNLAGELEGNYRVLEDIPDGMELSYIRIKWHADDAGKVTSQTIDGLGDEWKINTNKSMNDNGNQETTIYYYNKNKNQALIQLGEFEAGRVGDKYAVDVQVVCRVTDDKVLLGGEEKSFTNKVTLLSPDGQTIIDTASNEATMSKRDNLSKSDNFNRELVDNNTSQTINYTITANALGQTLPLNDGNKLTLVDKLGENLELDHTTIKAKDEYGNEVDINNNKSYDSKTNTLEISIPNGKKVIITYSVRVKVAPETSVDLSNKVYWKSYSENGGENDVIKGFKYRLAAGGSTEGTGNPQLTIKKIDEDKLEPMEGVKFDVYECELNGDAIKRVTSREKTSGTTDADGIYRVASSFITYPNKIYEVKETEPPDGYVENKYSYYIIYVEKKNGVNPAYVQKCIDYFNKQQDKNRYKIVDLPQNSNLVVYNSQKGITVKKAFTNNAAETEHNPVSGTYRFGLYENENGEGKPLEIISIHYDPKDKDVKSAKFKNPIDLKKDYYVFEIGQNNQPIKVSDDEATINSMQYKVVYKNETDSTKTNNAKVGETVIVTNKSRTKILPSTGSIGTLIYRLLGAMLVVASLICLSNINKNNRKEKRRKR